MEDEMCESVEKLITLLPEETADGKLIHIVQYISLTLTPSAVTGIHSLLLSINQYWFFVARFSEALAVCAELDITEERHCVGRRRVLQERNLAAGGPRSCARTARLQTV